MSQGSVSNGNQALRPRDVCQQLGIQPYVLKFWEGEFPQLGRRLGAKRLYGAEELKILSEIQRLVEGERLNLGQAREELARAFPSDEAPEPGPAPPPAAAPPSGGESVLNEAKEKIRRLEEQVAALEVQLAEKDAEVESLRHRHQQAAKAAAEVERERDTMAQRVDRLEAAAGRLESHSRQLEEELEAARPTTPASMPRSPPSERRGRTSTAGCWTDSAWLTRRSRPWARPSTRCTGP
ncbi:MAG: MerR family transcriptional regulator [Acidobacteriota bacterium]|nr:MerR family transcriptional regulator [Acidobacteriota bacterium]